MNSLSPYVLRIYGQIPACKCFMKQSFLLKPYSAHNGGRQLVTLLANQSSDEVNRT